MSTAISSNLKNTLSNRFNDRVFYNEPIAPYVAYQVGGPADILLFPRDESELDFIREFSKSSQLPVTVIGTGTNLLVHDEGIRGITVSLTKTFKDIEILDRKQSSVLVRCGGGVEKPELLNWSISQSLGGLEFSAGVPGTIGGGIYMNAGTKYGCYGDILRGLRLYDFEKGATQYKREEIDFGYRTQSLVTRKTLVAWVDLELVPADALTVQTEVDRIVAERAAKQPLDFPSCGSTFKNPPGFSAGRLVERSGLKGLRVGGAEISTKHANFILNKGNAKAADIMELIQRVKERVKKEFDVSLECEVILVGGSGAQQEDSV